MNPYEQLEAIIQHAGRAALVLLAVLFIVLLVAVVGMQFDAASLFAELLEFVL